MQRTTSINPGAAAVVDVKTQVSPSGFGAVIGERRLVEDCSASLEAADPASSGNEGMSIHPVDARTLEACGFVKPSFTWALSSPLAAATHAVAYSADLDVLGGIAPYTFALKSGDALPTGLSLNASTGVISGTVANAGGPYTFTIVATDANGRADSKLYSLTVG